MRKILFTIIFFVGTISAFAQATGPTLVPEIRKGIVSSINDGRFYPIIYKDKFYVSVRTSAGNKIYIYEGDTLQAFDEIYPSLSNLIVSFSPIIFNDKLYFSGNNGVNGYELWEYDGINPAKQVDDIAVGSASSGPNSFNLFNGKLMFVADVEGPTDAQLFEYDGINKPVRISPTNLIWGAVSSQNYIIYNDKLYYEAVDSSHGYELWVYDGINEPNLLYDLYPGKTDGNIRNFQIMFDKLYFEGRDESGLFKIYSLDKDGNVVKEPTGFEKFTGQFGARIESIIYNGIYYFHAQDYIDGGKKLWKYDGINPPIKTPNPLAPDNTNSIISKVLYKDKLYITSQSVGYPVTMYEYDFNSGYKLINDVLNESYIIYNDVLYGLYNNLTVGTEFGSFDGNKVELIKDINIGSVDSYPQDFLIYKGKLIFSAETEELGRELYVYNDGKVGVIKINDNTAIKTYPNPTSDVFNVELDYPVTTMRYTLTDAIGNVIEEATIQNTNGFNISLANQKVGIYFLTIIDGTERTVRKIVKM